MVNNNQKIIKEMSVEPLDSQLNYEFRSINNLKYFEQVNKLQLEAVQASEQIKEGMLRANTKDMIKSCLASPHESIGIFKENNLIGFGILYDPNVNPAESIKKDLDLIKEKRIAEIDDKQIMHIKLVVIDKNHQGHHLQYHMNKYLEEIAKNKGVKLLLTTVSPFNIPSVKNTFKAGFTYKKTVKKYDGASRLIYAKFLD